MKAETPPRSRAFYLLCVTAALWALLLSGIGESFGPPETVRSVLLGAAMVTLILAVIALVRGRSA